MQSCTVRDSVRLAFEIHGAEQDPLVLLISGAGAPAEFWPGSFCDDLAAHGRFVVRYSHRDTGLSSHFDEPYAIDELLSDMMAFVETFGDRVVHLVGHSMGAYLAQMAMCRDRRAVATVTSISAGSTVNPERAAGLGMSVVPDETWEVLLRNEPSGDFRRDLPGWMESWRFLNGTRPFDEDLAVRYTRALYVGDPRNAQVAVHHVHAMSTVPESLVDDLRTVSCPLLVLHGTVDPLVPPDHGEATARLVEGARFEPLQGVGHMFFDPAVWHEIGRAVRAHTAVSSKAADRS